MCRQFSIMLSRRNKAYSSVGMIPWNVNGYCDGCADGATDRDAGRIPYSHLYLDINDEYSIGYAAGYNTGYYRLLIEEVGYEEVLIEEDDREIAEQCVAGIKGVTREICHCSDCDVDKKDCDEDEFDEQEVFDIAYNMYENLDESAS